MDDEGENARVRVMGSLGFTSRNGINFSQVQDGEKTTAGKATSCSA